jgi:uncharacterized protein
VTTPQWPARGTSGDSPRASDAPAASERPTDADPARDANPARDADSASGPEPSGDPPPDPAAASIPGTADLPTDPRGFTVRPWPAAPIGAYQPGPAPYPVGLASPGRPQPEWVRPPPAGQPAYGWSEQGWGPMPPLPRAAPPPPPPHKWGFGAFLLAQAVFLLVSVLVVVLSGLAEAISVPTGAALVFSLAVPAVVAALVAIMITRWRGNGPVVDLRLKFGLRDVGIGVACGVAGVFVTIPAGMLWTAWVGEENASSAVGRIFAGMRLNPWLVVMVFLTVWLLAPLCEEILYRGLLWGAMERRVWSGWVILVISTVIFALAHGEWSRTPLLLVIGLPIGLARLLSGGLPAAIIAHQINNFLPALGLMLLLLGVPLTDV